MSRTQTVVQEPAIPFLLRVLYFFLFGWQAAGIWILIAWLLNLTIVGLPVGVWMLHRVPQVLTLRPVKQMTVASGEGEGARVIVRGLPQPAWPLRLVYFVLVGWWLSLLWALVAWVASVTIIGLPLGIWMFDRLPAVTTLLRT